MLAAPTRSPAVARRRTNAYDLQSLGFDYLHRRLPHEFGDDAGYHF